MKEELEKQLVEKYPGMFAEYCGDPTKTCMAYGCEHSDGWFHIVRALCVAIFNHQQAHRDCCPTPFVFKQIKQKFGYLRVYHNCRCDQVEGIVKMAEEMSGFVCEECGKPGTHQSDRRWWKTVCPDCAAKWN